MKIRPYQNEDESSLMALWEVCQLVSPKNNPKLDIQRKLKVNPEWLTVGEISGTIMASCMIGYEGHRGWINYLAVDPQYQHKGYAREIMQYAEDILLHAGCPKINLQVRTNNLEVIQFYQSIGFQPDEVVSLGKRLVSDS